MQVFSGITQMKIVNTNWLLLLCFSAFIGFAKNIC